MRYRTACYRNGALWVRDPLTGGVSKFPCRVGKVMALLEALRDWLACEVRYLPQMREDLALDVRAKPDPRSSQRRMSCRARSTAAAAAFFHRTRLRHAAR